MSKSKRQKNKRLRKQYTAAVRKRDAKRWLQSGRFPENLIEAYVLRYGLPESDAYIELLELGYQDELRIQHYEREGIEWEYKVDGYLGEMLVVPKGTPDWEHYEYW